MGLALPRSADLVVAMLGILKSGAAYLPIDPRFPSARLGLMLEQARPRLLLADAESAAALPPHDVPVLRPAAHAEPAGTSGALAPVHPDNAAYVMYTSGLDRCPQGRHDHPPQHRGWSWWPPSV
ncbi:Amino acid adenylation domain-containing protein (Fragment) OS=Streptomyces tendae OX=1932 GN=GUR47_38495 PE=4 SV=1 [Streptomyces tendae]